MQAIRIETQPSRTKLIAAFASIYLIWGSTYLAIVYAIETLPPFIMAGARFLIAGAVIYIWARLSGAEKPKRANWSSAAIVGALLLLGGNGAVVWAEQRVPSGLAALLVTTIPIWMVMLDGARTGTRPSKRVIGGLLLGFAGLAFLLDPGKLMGGPQLDLVGAGVLMLGSFSWAAGSLYARRADLPSSPLLATGMEMLMGGALLLAAGTVTGQWARLDLAALSVKSGLALGYLIVFGSIIGFTAYSWLLKVSTPARVSTYAYVNPIVAVFLGWVLAGEPITMRTILAASVIVGAVFLITTHQTKSRNIEDTEEHEQLVMPKLRDLRE